MNIDVKILSKILAKKAFDKSLTSIYVIKSLDEVGIEGTCLSITKGALWPEQGVY